MRNLCFNRFTLRTEHAATRRKILRWMAVNYRIYEYNPAENEISGRFISRRPFPQAAFRQLLLTMPVDRTLFLRIISTDLYSLYLEGNVYRIGRWYNIRL